MAGAAGRLPIRVRLTAAFAATMLAMLTGAALFVYLRLRADLDDAVNARLLARAQALSSTSPDSLLSGVVLEDHEESFVQVLTVDGAVLNTVGKARSAALSPAQSRTAAGRSLLVEGHVEGIDGVARMLARPHAGRHGPVVLLAGQSLNDRNEALSGVVTSFAGGGAVAVLLASMTGYLLARAGLAPVEAIRRRALQVSLAAADEGLPLPVARDEVRRLGQTLNDMLDRLRASFERERRFVADASHELRTPIAVVKTELEAALRTGDYGPAVRQGLLAAVEECDRLAQLADDLLVLARLSEAGLPVRAQPIRPRSLLEEVRDRYVDRAVQRDRHVDVQVAVADDRAFDADPDRLRQALGNLFDNSLRHGAGDITLRVRRADAGVWLEVTDCGPGFAPDIAGRAFERFARGDAARTRGGAGLGLAIVAAVAHAHGGTAAIIAAPDPRPIAGVRIWLPDRLS